MDHFRKHNVICFSWDGFLNAALILFAVWGLVTKLLLSLNLRLDSDSVGMGLISMEIGKHHNYLLSGYHLLSSDSLVFTELVPFQLVPQILTNYNPVALKIMVFFLFVLSVLEAAYLVWFVSGSRTSALLFTALAAAIPPEGYFWLSYPTTHNATILFGLVILIILFSLQRLLKGQRESHQKTKKKKTQETLPVPWPHTLSLVMLVFLSVFSDTLILVWVIVPYIVAYLVLFRRERGGMDFVVGAVAITSVIAYTLKTLFMSDWIPSDYTVNTLSDIILNLPLFFKAVFLFLNQGFFSLLENAASVSLEDVLLLVLFSGVVLLCIQSWWSGLNSITPEKRLFYAVLLLSVLLMAAAFLVSGYVHHITAARYLTFTAFVLLMLVAVSCPVTEKACAFLILVLLIVSAASGSMYISTMNTSPNEREYALITYLKSQNLTFGYGTYWNSNVISYLSGEEVTVRSVYIAPDDLLPDRLNSCDRWFTGRPERFFLIYDKTRPADEAQKNYPLLVKTVNTTDILRYRDYEIFLFHPV